MTKDCAGIVWTNSMKYIVSTEYHSVVSAVQTTASIIKTELNQQLSDNISFINCRAPVFVNYRETFLENRNDFKQQEQMGN